MTGDMGPEGHRNGERMCDGVSMDTPAGSGTTLGRAGERREEGGGDWKGAGERMGAARDGDKVPFASGHV